MCRSSQVNEPVLFTIENYLKDILTLPVPVCSEPTIQPKIGQTRTQINCGINMGMPNSHTNKLWQQHGNVTSNITMEPVIYDHLLTII